MVEDTLVILKPDALSRGLVGTVIDRLEKVGLKMVACKMVRADEAIINKMYDTQNKQWVEGLGEKTLATMKQFEIDPVAYVGSDDPYTIGMDVAKSLKEYMRLGPVIVMVWEGIQAVAVVRKIRGSTTPISASVGSILGDLSYDSQIAAPIQGRSLRNIAHASGTIEEANKEIELWFGKDFTPMEYDRTDSIFF